MAQASIQRMTTQTLTTALAQAWVAHRTLSAAAWQIADEAEAYGVHDGLVAALAWQPGGRPHYWKSGSGSRAARLTHAPLAPAGVRHGARLDFSDLHLRAPGVEAEIALRLRADVTPTMVAALTPPSAAALIDALAVSVELVSSRWQEGLTAPALLRLADCQSHGALALGDWQALDVGHDWSAQACSLTINDGMPLQGLGCHPLGDPLWGLTAWLQHVTRDGASLPAGSVVTTGAWLVNLSLQAGDRATIRFAGLGEVCVQL